MRAFACLLLIVSLVLPAWGGAETNNSTATSISRSSPRDTYQSFLTLTKQIEAHYADYMADKTLAKVHVLRKDLERARRLMDLSALPISTRVKVGNSAIGYLNDILARVPPLDPADIPGRKSSVASDPLGMHVSGDSALPPSWTIPGTDIQIAYIESGLHGGNYMFTAESIASLPAYYQETSGNEILNPNVYPDFHLEQMNATGVLISERVIDALPEAFKTAYLDTPAWKIIAIIVIGFAFVVISLVWIRAVHHSSAPMSSLRRIWWRMTIPLVILVLLWGCEWFVATQINPTGTFAASNLMVVTLVRYVAASVLAWLAIHLVIEAIVRSPRISAEHYDYDANLLRLAGRIVGFVAVGAVLGYGADQLGIPALGLLAGLGVGGVAIALASQSTLENLFAGLSLFADRPFSIDDYILIDSQTASVVRIGARSSRLRARDGTLYTVPNADLAKMRIVNLTARDSCFLDQSISLKENSAPETIQALLEKLRGLLNETDLVEKKEGWPRVYMVGVSPGKIELSLQARFQTVDFNTFLIEQERLMLSAIGIIRDHGLELAMPCHGPHSSGVAERA